MQTHWNNVEASQEGAIRKKNKQPDPKQQIRLSVSCDAITKNGQINMLNAQPTDGKAGEDSEVTIIIPDAMQIKVIQEPDDNARQNV